MWDLSSLTRDRTRVPCIGRQIVYHWTTREVPTIYVFAPAAHHKCCAGGHARNFRSIARFILPQGSSGWGLAKAISFKRATEPQGGTFKDFRSAPKVSPRLPPGQMDICLLAQQTSCLLPAHLSLGRRSHTTPWHSGIWPPARGGHSAQQRYASGESKQL